MSTLVLAALIFFAVAVVAGLALVAVRGLAAWRTLRAFQRRLGAATREVTTTLAAIERHSAGLPDRLARLGLARAELERSLAELRVVTGGASEAMALVRSVRSLVPSR